MTDANALLAPHAAVTAATLTPEIQLRLNSIMIQEIGRVSLVVRALALEHPAKPPAKRGRPRRAMPAEPAIAAAAHSAAALLAFMGLRLSAEQAREIAGQLLEAAEALVAAQDNPSDPC
jgi:hypothetical protein